MFVEFEVELFVRWFNSVFKIVTRSSVLDIYWGLAYAFVIEFNQQKNFGLITIAKLLRVQICICACWTKKLYFLVCVCMYVCVCFFCCFLCFLFVFFILLLHVNLLLICKFWKQNKNLEIKKIVKIFK